MTTFVLPTLYKSTKSFRWIVQRFTKAESCGWFVWLQKLFLQKPNDYEMSVLSTKSQAHASNEDIWRYVSLSFFFTATLNTQKDRETEIHSRHFSQCCIISRECLHLIILIRFSLFVHISVRELKVHQIVHYSVCKFSIDNQWLQRFEMKMTPMFL